MVREFHAPRSLEEALRLKRDRPGALFIAGGTGLNALDCTVEPPCLVSLAHLGLGGVEATDEVLVVGATCTLQELVEAPEVPEVLREAAMRVTNRNVRNVATLGGHLAMNKSCADVIPALVALQARVDVVDEQGAASELVLWDYLSQGRTELILRVRIPRAGRAAAIDNFTRSSNDVSVITVGVGLEREGDLVRQVVVAVGGVAAHVVRLTELEASLEGQPLPDRDTLEARVRAQVSPIDDLRGTAAFKAQVAAAQVARALHRAE